MNAPYHTVKTDGSWSPTMNCRKGEIQDWLTKEVIAWDAGMLKPELYELVKQHKKEPVYVCDQLALEHGFDVLRLPPYHCTFNPIELIWAAIKGEVARRNTTSRLNDVLILAKEALANHKCDGRSVEKGLRALLEAVRRCLACRWAVRGHCINAEEIIIRAMFQMRVKTVI